MNRSRIFSLIFILGLMITPAFFLSKCMNDHTKNLPSLAILRDNFKNERTIPPFSFINQNNDTVTNDYYKDKIYIANFIFTTCPTQCKDMTFNMEYLQGKLSKYDDVYFLSHTVNPEYDTPEVLNQYATRLEKELGADLSKWNFVTGTKIEIYEIAKSYLVSAGVDTSGMGHNGFIHDDIFTLVDGQGRIRAGWQETNNPMDSSIRIYYGTQIPMIKEMVRDVGVLVSETKRLQRNAKNQ